MRWSPVRARTFDLSRTRIPMRQAVRIWRRFADESFDLVYSYAVFQHIPSRDVVMQYLREAKRVLKTGGLLRCQINGLDKTAKIYDTWSGVRIGADEVRDYALENDMQLLALKVCARNICGRRCASDRQDGEICEVKAGPESVE